jgi:hypothetical protein
MSDRLRNRGGRGASPGGYGCACDVRIDARALRILQLAAERHVDVIAMGAHGRTGLRHLLLGGVAAKGARLAPCPVLTVPSAVPSAHSA